MNGVWRDAVWGQFGAAIDMLEAAIEQCPEPLWCEPGVRPHWVPNGVVGFWYIAFHALFWLDYYLDDERTRFAPPPPFTLDEMDPAGLLPERSYRREELQRYLTHCRAKCRSVLLGIDDEALERRHKFWTRELTGAELLLYNMRHVQHHTAQLYLLLRQGSSNAPGWIAEAKCPLQD